MRHFHSYGPVDCEEHFCVQRKELIDRCTTQLIGNPEKGGHYFTIWAPRQTGKTWLMRRVKEEIPQRYPDQFTVFSFSLGNLRGMSYSPSGEGGDVDLPVALRDVLEIELPGSPNVENWKEFSRLFSKEGGLWHCPLILLIDEADTAPPALLDLLAGRFREMYLNREPHWLHGLALIGVRAVLGIESQRGSPFNIQRALHVPNFTKDEVNELYRQYQEESGQSIEPAVVGTVNDMTRGQPGLVGWFGELLTETYNPGQKNTIDLKVWEYVYVRACHVEFNNTVLNLIKKARTEYRNHVLELFSRSDVVFSLDTDWCNYMYLHGLIDEEMVESDTGTLMSVCRFASPFIQLRIYNALTYDLFDARTPILTLDPLDELTNVFEGKSLNLAALLQRYQDYLARLKAKGINPWKAQPRRKTDVHLIEAVGHFHLYAWLKEVLHDLCVVSPEFPTGNGKVDLHLRCGTKQGIIEVKSFTSASRLKKDRTKAAQYAKSLHLDTVTMAVFIPIEDKTVLEKLSGEQVIQGVRVTVVAIGWV